MLSPRFRFATTTSRKSLIHCALPIGLCALAAGCAPLQPQSPTQAALVPSANATNRCFEPLATPNSRDHKQWKDMLDRLPTALGKGAKRYLHLKDPENIGDYINLDYYALTFQQPANKSLEDFFYELRQHFPDLVQGDYANYRFHPFGGWTGDFADTNRKLWEQKKHDGAVMSFKLETVEMEYEFATVIQVIAKYGEVVTSCSSPTDFIFSTVESVEGNKHPVAGHRGFGLKDNGNGTWTFHSKATDRLSSFVGNHILRRFAFKKGDEFWDYFYANMKAYLSAQGLKVDPVIIKNRTDPDAWPLRDID